LDKAQIFFVDRHISWYSSSMQEKGRGCKNSTQEGKQKEVENKAELGDRN